MSQENFTAILLNLDRDTARFDHMCKQLARARVSFTRQPGILGDAVPNDLRHYFYDEADVPKTKMKRGEIGCYASHLRALKLIANGEYGDTVLVMEDDLDIDPDLIALVNEVRQVIPAGWDIIRLSNPPRRAYAPLVSLDNERFLVRYSKIPNSAGAYLVTPDGAKKFLQKGVRGLTLDDDLRRPWFHDMNTYGIVPPPVHAGVMNASTIDAVEAGRFDKGMSSRKERIVRGDHFHAFKRLVYNKKNLGTVSWLACSLINICDMIAKPIVGHSIIHNAAKLFPAMRKT